MNNFSKIKIFNLLKEVRYNKYFTNVVVKGGEEFFLENSKIIVAISEKGLLKSITDKKTMELLPLNLNFVQ